MVIPVFGCCGVVTGMASRRGSRTSQSAPLIKRFGRLTKAMQPLMPLAQGERLPTLESQKREVGDGGRSLLKRRGLFAISEKQREADT
jgi:hypothetical protein